MKRNALIIIVAAVILLISCVAGVYSFHKLSSNVGEVEPDLVLRYGEVNAEGHIMSESAEYFAKQVKNLSKGKVIVEIYPSGQLGDDEKCYKMMQMGALDLYRGNCNSLTEDSMLQVMALPYLYENSTHFWNVCESELGQDILNDIENKVEGIKGLAFLDEGARNFFTTEKPINKLEDVKGMRIRVQNSSLMKDTLAALGAIPVPSEYVELYSALKGNLVDGAENPAISYYYNKFYEVAPYYVKDMHTYSPGVILISSITWSHLSKEYQEIIQEAARRTQQFNRREIEKSEMETYEAMQKAGVQVTEVSDMERWKEAMRPVLEKYGDGYEDIIELIKAMK